MKTNRKMYYASIGVALISGLALVMGCTSKDKKPVPPPEVKPVIEEVKKQPPQTPPEKAPVQVDTTKPITPLPADAKGLLQQAVQNTFSTQSYVATMTMNTEIMGMNMSFDFNIKKSGNILYESGSILGMYFEMYSDSATKIAVLKNPRIQRWQRQPPTQENLLFDFEQIQRKLYLENIKDACFKEDGKIGEKNCQVIEATMNSEELQKMVMNRNDLPMGFGNFSLDKVILKLWIGKDDTLLYKTSASLEGSMTMGAPTDEMDIEEEDNPVSPTDTSGKVDETSPDNQMSKFKYEIEMTYANYNKLEPIIIPPDAKNAMENLQQDEMIPEDEEEIPENK